MGKKLMITQSEILKDIELIAKKYGIKFILILCSKLIYEHQKHNWHLIKKELEEHEP